MQRWSIRFAIVAAMPLVVVGLLLLTLRPDEPERVGADTPNGTLHVFKFTNNTQSQADDLHVTFSSPVTKPAITNQPPACDEAVISVEDTVVSAVWASIKCVNGFGIDNSVTIEVYSKDEALAEVAVSWTNGGTPLPTITQTITVTTTATPSPSVTASPSTTASPSVTASPTTPTSTLETPTATPQTPTNTPETPTSTTTPVTPTDTPATVPPTSTYTNTPPSTNTPGTPAQPKICGDVDLTKSVTSVDAALVLQFSASLLDSLQNPRNADVNADGQITSIDSLLILQHVAGLLQNLNCA